MEKNTEAKYVLFSHQTVCSGYGTDTFFLWRVAKEHTEGRNYAFLVEAKAHGVLIGKIVHLSGTAGRLYTADNPEGIRYEPIKEAYDVLLKLGERWTKPMPNVQTHVKREETMADIVRQLKEERQEQWAKYIKTRMSVDIHAEDGTIKSVPIRQKLEAMNKERTPENVEVNLDSI